MSKSLLVRTMAGVIAVSALSACYVNPRPRVGVEYVMRQPPVERVEVIPASPGVEYVWVGGHWGWARNDYAWVPGRWVVPARGYREWVPGRWERDRGGWFFVEGHWR